MKFDNVYFITGTAYAGKSTLVKQLAQKYNGIACEENYHDQLSHQVNQTDFPYLSYTKDLVDWHDFVRRTPDEYEAWIDGVSRECETLELRILETLHTQGKPVFVDTNICTETLHQISDTDHVLVMLADPMISVNRFFQRPDREKQFLYQLLLEEPNPENAMENFRNCLARVNSPERCERYLNAGFHVLLRDDARTVEQTVALAEKLFKLC